MKIHFLASFMTAEPQGDAWKIVFMDEGEVTGRGWGIWQAGLQASLPRFENVWVQGLRFEGGELDHLNEDVRAVFPTGVIVGNIVGMAGKSQLETLANGKQGITGWFRPASPKLHTLLTMAKQAGKLSDFGLSINGDVTNPAHLTRRTLASGATIAEVLEIDELYSVDMVSYPGRGGGFLDMLASAGLYNQPRQQPNKRGRPMNTATQLKALLEKKGLTYEDSTAPLSILASIGIKAAESNVGGEMSEADQKLFESIYAALSAGMDDIANKIMSAVMPVEAAAEPPAPAAQPAQASQRKDLTASSGSAPSNQSMPSIDKAAIYLTKLIVRDLLADSGLNETTKTLIASSFEGKVAEESDIKAEIDKYKTIIASVSDEGHPKHYTASANIGLNSADKIQQAFDQMCGVNPALFKEAIQKMERLQAYPAAKIPQTFGVRASAKLPDHYDYPSAGLRELYVLTTGDTSISFNFGHLRKTGILASAVKETTPFGDALGTSLNRRLIQDWMMKELDWRKIATIKPGGFSDFRAQEIINVGGFGEIATVDDDGEYQELSLSTDTKESYTPLTKGNLLPITRRTVLRDDVGLVNRLIAALRRSAQYTFHKAFFYAVAGWNSAAINDYTCADGVVLYHAASHGNLVNGAYNYSNLKAGKLLMRQQTEKDSSIWLNLVPKYQVIPVTFEDDGLVYLTSERLPGDVVNDANTIRLNEEDVIVVDDSLLGGSATYGYLFCDPKDYETIEVAFLGNQQVPEIFTQNDPTVGDTFKQDRFTWKIRLEYGIGIADYRGMVRIGA